MAEALAGLLTSALVGIAKDKLGSAVAGQASLMWNFGNDLEDMEGVLETISAALEDAERRSVKEKLVQLWLKRLKYVALDISDILDDYQDTGDQTPAKNPSVLSCLPIAYKKAVMANRMKSVREKLRKINLEFENFMFITTLGTSTTIVQHYDKRETIAEFLPEVKGRDGEKQKIINLLYACTNNEERGTMIVPIYGLGGMGKSTLAQLVYNDDQFNKYDHRVWVYVSQDFNLLQIGSSIISQLQIGGGQQNGDHWNRDLQVMKQRLDNLLQDKKVLIVLDDLWEQDDTELSKLKSMLQVSKNGSMIDVIVTTRDEEIAAKVSNTEPYKLQPLSADICWEIIKKSSKCNQKEVELIGLDIAKKCGGVPLAAQALGSMLQSKDLSYWKKINDSDIWNETADDRVLPSLKLSYQWMPQQLRICFSFCAIFSKGYNFFEDDLIHQWSALGLTETSRGKEYIKQLLGMSFLQVSKLPSTSEEHVVRYTMHDLVHDLARLTMGDQLIVFNDVPQRKTRANKYCLYSLLRKYDRSKKLENMPSKMRALRFSESGELLDIPNGAFSFAKYLRTLDFSECSGIFLPASIGQMKQLMCLIAPRMQNESLPECITEMSKLQYLNINGSSKITQLPGSIGKLGCLKYLGLSGCSDISRLPESFGDLKCMVHLDMSGCSGIKELPDSLGNLTNLQHLELSGCSVQEIPVSVCGLTKLLYLNLSSCHYLDQLPKTIGGLVNLEYLNLSYCKKIRELPESLKKLQNLLHLNLESCSPMFESSEEVSDVLGKLINLKYLSLRHCNTGNEEYMCDDEFIGTLTNLERLDLSANYCLARLPESIGNLKRLHTLNLSLCQTLKSLPDSIGNLKRLHTLDLSYCHWLKSLPDSIGALGLKSLVLDGCSDELMDQASSLLVDFSQMLPLFKVRADDVNGCSNLHLLEGVHVGELRIHSFENVRSLEEANNVKLCDKHNLSELTLAWNVGAVRHLEDKDLLGQLLPPRGLKRMRLRGYSSTGFPGWLTCISDHLTNLVYIQLCDLPTCTNLPPLGQLQHLEKLFLTELPSIKKIDSEFCGGNGAFRRLSSFDVWDMEGLEEWNTTYSVKDGVQEFMFPVLDCMIIFQCPRLRLTPCPPTFRECGIYMSDQVISSLEEVDKTSHHCSSPSRAIKLNLDIKGDSRQSIRLFQHFPELRELIISGHHLTRVPESIRHLTSLESLKLGPCDGIAALPEWLGDLSSLKRLDIEDCSIKYLPESMRHLTSLESLTLTRCKSIKSLPACIQQLTKLQKLVIMYNYELKEWCESEENKMKLAHISNVELRD